MAKCALAAHWQMAHACALELVALASTAHETVTSLSMRRSFAPCCVRASQNYLETGLSGLRCSIALRHRAMLGCVRNNSVHVMLGPACMRSWAAYEQSSEAL